MSVTNCMVQFYLLCVPTIAQSLLLAAMSFDRYAAICNPLHYMSVMTFKLQLYIAAYCWASGVLTALLAFAFLHPLVFCLANVINHFYCDIAPIIELSCSDTSIVELVVSLDSMFVFFSPFVFIIGTYVSILRTILRIPSGCGRQKAFSTCSSHLSVVFVYYGTLTAIYLYSPGKHSLNANKFLSLLYIVVTPLFNPIIYSLRNQDIKRAIRKCVLGKVTGFT
ncbi:olfactory receptor 10R2-like [Xenopus tropicalis]|uniref:Olfactory receptor 10R2-like n=1 Tax=Xenopus tropicalis TaxID=8364 RepID=A0A8J1JBZ8_XENTR|nr:olfactory receptor 10R2-like [Xenopus tropicalis]